VVADRGEGPPGQDPVGAPAAPGRAGHDHQERGSGGPQGDPAGEQRRDLQDRPAREQGGEAGPAECDAQGDGEAQQRQRDREHPAERELPQPRPGVEVRPGLPFGGGDHRVGQGRREHDGAGREHRDPRSGVDAVRGERGEGDQRQPHQVELALDRQRPEVLERALRVVPGEVVDGVDRERPVLEVQARGHGLRDDVVAAGLGQQQPAHEQDRQQHHGGGGEEPAREPRQERHGPDAAVAFDGAEQGSGDEEAGQEQEDVDAAGDPAEPDVVDGDEEDREGAQSLEFRAEPGTGRHVSRLWNRRVVHVLPSCTGHEHPMAP
jgi:hypothetical protein